MAETGLIGLEIVTPTGVVLNANVTEFTAPSVDGDFGVLPGHRPLLAALRTGIVTYSEGGQDHRVAVGSGFVEVGHDQAVMLTDRFIPKKDIDVVRVRLDLKHADESLDAYEGDEYRRVEVSVCVGEGTVRAWLYVLAEQPRAPWRSLDADVWDEHGKPRLDRS